MVADTIVTSAVVGSAPTVVLANTGSAHLTLPISNNFFTNKFTNYTIVTIFLLI